MIDLALQEALGNALVGSPALLALVEAEAILDAGLRPTAFPAIQIGTAQTVLESATFARAHVRCFLDLHIWTEGDGLAPTKEIAGAVQAALKPRPVIEHVQVLDWRVTSTKFLRDPSNVGHAVVTVECLVMERLQ